MKQIMRQTPNPSIKHETKQTPAPKYLAKITMALCAMACAMPVAVKADTSFTINNTTADAFLASGSAANPVGANLTGLNFGSAGTLAIAPTNSTKGEFDSVLMFTSAGAVSQFNATYGPGNWKITGLTLSLSS